MANYSATKNASGAYDVSLDGNKVTTGSESILGNYGLSPTKLSATSLGATESQTTPNVPVQDSTAAQNANANFFQPGGGGTGVNTNIGTNPQANTNIAFGAVNNTNPTPEQQLADKYKTGLATAQASTTPVPTSSGAGSAGVTDITGGPTQQPQINPVDSILGEDQGYQQLFQDYKDFNDSNAQKETLTSEYDRLTKEAGLPELNTQLMNMKNVIDGTETDIRNEITKAGGFATESAVLALTGARNKTMIQNYNNLLDTKNNATNQINTMIGLSQQDRQYAQDQFQNKLQLDQQIIDYGNKMQANATSAYQKIIDAPGYGYKALYDSTGGDAHTVDLVEKTLGLQPGQLSQLSNSANSNSQWGQTYSLGGNIVQKNNQTGEIRTVVSGGSSGSGTGAGSTSDPQTQAWVTSILNGNSTMQQVPNAYRNAVAMAMANAPADSYSPLAASRFANAANKIVANYKDLPAYQLTAGGQVYLGRIDAALKTPGSVSDQDLLDSLTKLNTGGNAISDAQVKIITDGKSLSDWKNTIANKFSTGGVLSDTQRQQIQTIAKAIFDSYKKQYQPIYDKAVAQMDAAGIPKAFQNLPDLNNLSQQSQDIQTSTPSSLPPDIQTKLSSNLSFSSDGKTAYIPRSVWSTLGDSMDAVLKEAQQEGFTLLIK